MQTKRDSNSSRFLHVVSGDIFKKYCVSQDLLANTVSACRHFLKCFDYKEWARSNMTRKAALIFTWLYFLLILFQIQIGCTHEIRAVAKHISYLEKINWYIVANR